MKAITKSPARRSVPPILTILSVLLFSCGGGNDPEPNPPPPPLPLAITTVLPGGGDIGDVITITGTSFSDDAGVNSVKFNNVSATVLTASTTTLTVEVPQTTNGPVTVTVDGKTVTGPLFVIGKAVSAGGTGFESGHAVTTDKDGNVYVTGSFTGTVAFGSKSVTAQGTNDIFVVKYDANYNPQWVTPVGGSAYLDAYAIKVDEQGYSYVTGSIAGTAYFGNKEVNSEGGSADVYVVRFDPSGNVVWATRLGGMGTDGAMGLALDSDENVLVAGQFFQTVTFGSASLTASGAASDIFVSKLDREMGNVVWAKRFGGDASDNALAIAVNTEGDIYLAGCFSGTTTFGSTDYTSTELDGFVAKLDESGELVWSKQIEGAGWGSAKGVAVDPSGNCVVTGYFAGSATLGNIDLSSTGYENIFVAKYDAATGDVLWAEKAGGQDYNNGNDVAVDDSGNIFVTGYFSTTATFGSTVITSTGIHRDIFVARLNNSGVFQSVKYAGGEESDHGNSIAVDPSGGVHITGTYRDYDVTFGITPQENRGADDIFLWATWP